MYLFSDEMSHFVISDEDGSDSAFPARTPEQVKSLDDLLEEDVSELIPSIKLFSSRFLSHSKLY